MGHKIFISYKYADEDVYNLDWFQNSTARDYVTELQNRLDSSNHINKGEKDDEDLSELDDNTIWEKLKDRIYDSTLTIVLISPNMKEEGKRERDQWIPWEISYSLKETNRRTETGEDKTSKANAMLAIVLPDSNNSYSYFLEEKNCCGSYCITHHTEKLFDILRKNKFNLINASKKDCNNNSNDKVWIGECSYIKAVKWKDFINNMDFYIDQSYERLDDIENYDITKEL